MALTIDKKGALKYGQVMSDLVGRIERSQWKVGDAIPPVPMLARQYGVHRLTILKALGHLSQAGYLSVEQGRGTFVKETARPKFIGLLFGDDIYNQPSSRYSPMLARAAERFFRSKGFEVKFYVEHPHLVSQGIANRDLMSDLEKGALSGLVSAQTANPERTFLASAVWKKGCVPYVLIGALESVPHRVHGDQLALARLGLDYLRHKKRRRVAVIGYSKEPSDEKMELLRSEIRKRGLQTCDEWLPITPVYTEEHGYESARQVWKCSSKPDALLITDDIMGKGAIQAMLQLGLRVPGDVTIICQTIKGSGIFYPIPIARLEYDAVKIVKSAGQLLLEQMRQPHVPPRTIRVPPKLRLENEIETAAQPDEQPVLTR